MSSKPARFSRPSAAAAKRRKAAGFRRLCRVLSTRRTAGAVRAARGRCRSPRSVVRGPEPRSRSPSRFMPRSRCRQPPPKRRSIWVRIGEPALLAVVEGLVERIGGIGDLLHRRRRGRHVVGALAQARHRIVRLLRILRIVRLRRHPRIGAIDPQLGEIPHRGLDRRPQLFLIGASASARHGRRRSARRQRPPCPRGSSACVRETTDDDAGHRPRSSRRWRARRRRRAEFLHANLLARVARG